MSIVYRVNVLFSCECYKGLLSQKIKWTEKKQVYIKHLSASSHWICFKEKSSGTDLTRLAGCFHVISIESYVNFFWGWRHRKLNLKIIKAKLKAILCMETGYDRISRPKSIEIFDSFQWSLLSHDRIFLYFSRHRFLVVLFSVWRYKSNELSVITSMAVNDR